LREEGRKRRGETRKGFIQNLNKTRRAKINERPDKWKDIEVVGKKRKEGTKGKESMTLNVVDIICGVSFIIFFGPKAPQLFLKVVPTISARRAGLLSRFNRSM